MELLEQAVGDHLPKAWRTSNSVDDVDIDIDVDVDVDVDGGWGRKITEPLSLLNWRQEAAASNN